MAEALSAGLQGVFGLAVSEGLRYGLDQWLGQVTEHRTLARLDLDRRGHPRQDLEPRVVLFGETVPGGRDLGTVVGNGAGVGIIYQCVGAQVGQRAREVAAQPDAALRLRAQLGYILFFAQPRETCF